MNSRIYSTQYSARGRITRPWSTNFTIQLRLNLDHWLLVFTSTTNLESGPCLADICSFMISQSVTQPFCVRAALTNNNEVYFTNFEVHKLWRKLQIFTFFRGALVVPGAVVGKHWINQKVARNPNEANQTKSFKPSQAWREKVHLQTYIPCDVIHELGSWRLQFCHWLLSNAGGGDHSQHWIGRREPLQTNEADAINSVGFYLQFLKWGLPLTRSDPPCEKIPKGNVSTSTIGIQGGAPWYSGYHYCLHCLALQGLAV